MVATPVLKPVRRWWLLSQAPEGIFGTIVCASVLAASADGEPVHEVGWGVLITLIIYWLAERWSELVAGRLRGESLTRGRVWTSLRAGWPIVQACYPPMAVLLVAWLCGASNDTAENLALASCVLNLMILGTLAGRRVSQSWSMAGLSGFFTGLLGVALILLKAILH